MKIKVYDVKPIKAGERYVLSCKFTETSKVETFVTSSEAIDREVRKVADLIYKTIEFDFEKLKVCTFKEDGVDIFGNYIHSFKVVSEIKDFVAVVKKFYVIDETVKLVCSKIYGDTIVLTTHINNVRKYFDCYKIPDLTCKTIKFIGVDLKKSAVVTPEGRLYEFEKFEILDTVDKSENLKNSPIYTEELGNILKLLNLTQVKL